MAGVAKRGGVGRLASPAPTKAVENTPEAKVATAAAKADAVLTGAMKDAIAPIESTMPDQGAKPAEEVGVCTMEKVTPVADVRFGWGNVLIHLRAGVGTMLEPAQIVALEQTGAAFKRG